MSRVHDALRRAEQLLEAGGDAQTDPQSLAVSDETGMTEQSSPVDVPAPATRAGGLTKSEPIQVEVDWRNFLARCRSIPFRPAPETHLIDVERPHEVPAEEFRSLRTRLNHLQVQQDLHSLVVTSASPAEGKTFTAVNADPAAPEDDSAACAGCGIPPPVLRADVPRR